MYLFIVSIVIALVVSFFCSLAEATLLSLTPGEVAEFSQKHPRIGKIWQHFKSAIDRPIVVILVLNTAAHTVGATIAGAQFEKIWHSGSILLFSISFTLAILLLTEILPKTLGVEYRKRLAFIMAPPLNFLIKLFSPLIFVAQLINKPFAVAKKSQSVLALDELRALAAYARLSNLIGSYQEKIIHEASRLSQKTAKEIMIPASEIIYFEENKSMEDLIVRAHLDPHTRFPVCAENNVDKIFGYINFKELLFLAKNNPINPVIAGIIRPVKFVSPETSLTGLLHSFIEEHIHIAIVQSNEGKTLGLITLEDIIEEFLGDIEDEFDRLPKMCHPLAGGSWMVGGGVLWWDLAKQLSKPFETFDGTFSAWLLNKAKRPLKTGDVVIYQDLDFVIRRIRRGKVFEVMILPHQEPASPSPL